MDELETRFEVLDEFVMPDLWSKAERRTPTPDRTRGEPPRGAKRLLVAAAALAIAAATTVLVVRAFGGPASLPVAPTQSSTRVGTIVGRLALVDLSSTERIVLVNADGSGLSDLVEGRDPSWSPDGTQIAFRTGDADRAGGNPTSIDVIDVDGSHRHALGIPASVGGETSWGSGPAVWSPGGSHIAFATVSGIYMMRPDGSGLHRLSRYEGQKACYDLEPTWSPDAQRVVFADHCDGEDAGLSSVKVDGSDRRQLLPISDQIQAAAYPAFSPDGKRIAFAGADPAGAWSIYVMDANGSNVRKVVDPSEALFPPAWSPDGTMITFTQAGTGTLNAVEIATGSVHPIAAGLGYSCCAAWQPIPIPPAAILP